MLLLFQTEWQVGIYAIIEFHNFNSITPPASLIFIGKIVFLQGLKTTTPN